MSFRSTQALILAGLFTLGAAGCSSGGGSSSAGPTPMPGVPEGIQPSSNDFTDQAELLLLQENFQAALDAANQSLATEPDNALGYVQAARAQIGLGDYSGAASNLDRAEELYPSYEAELRAHRETGWVQAYNEAIGEFQNGNEAGALDKFEQGHAIFQGRPEAMLQLGSMYAQADRQDDAMAIYREALDLVSGPAAADVDSATAEGWVSSEEIAAMNLAQLYAQNDRPQDAVGVYSDFLGRYPGNISALSNLGAVLVMADQSDSAMVIYDQILARDDLNAREYFVTGVGLYNVEAYDRASVAFGKSAGLNPRNRDAQYNYAQTLYLASDFADLYNQANRLIELDPHNQQAYVLAYQGLKETDREQEGNELIERADGLEFLLEIPALQPVAGGGAVLTGDFKNVSLDEGTAVTIRFHFTGLTGEEVATQDVRVTAPAADQSTSFRAEGSGMGDIIGYWYEVVS